MAKVTLSKAGVVTFGTDEDGKPIKKMGGVLLSDIPDIKGVSFKNWDLSSKKRAVIADMYKGTKKVESAVVIAVAALMKWGTKSYDISKGKYDVNKGFLERANG